MNPFVFVVALFSLAAAQLPSGPGVTPPPWRGPLADHVIGLPPKDTAEVATAKQQLQRAYQEVLAVLPELPPEIRYQPGKVVMPIQQSVHTPQPHHAGLHQSGFGPVPVQQAQPFGQPQPFRPPQAMPGFTKFAEEIPRSPLGEVPEVALARSEHLAAFEAAQASLPRLVQPLIPVQPVHHFVQNYNQAPQDTPEVQAAKAQHAAAFAASG